MADPLEGLPEDHTTWTAEHRRIYRERLEDQKFEDLAQEAEPTTEYGDMDEDFNPLPPSDDRDLDRLRTDADRLRTEVEATLELDRPSLDPDVAHELWNDAEEAAETELRRLPVREGPGGTLVIELDAGGDRAEG